MLLAKTADRYKVSFCVADGTWDEAAIITYYEELGGRLADDLFGRPMNVGFVDEYLEQRKTITIGDEM